MDFDTHRLAVRDFQINELEEKLYDVYGELAMARDTLAELTEKADAIMKELRSLK